MSPQGARGGRTDDSLWLDVLLMCVVGVLAVLAGLVWLTAQLAAVVHTGHPVPLTLADAARAVPGLGHQPSRPAAAFPAPTGSRLPGPALFYLAAVLVLAVTGAALATGWRVWTRLAGGHATGHGYASGAEIRRSLSARAAAQRGTDRRKGHRRGPRPHRRGSPADSAQTPDTAVRRRRTGRVDSARGVYLGRDIRSRQHLYGAAEDSYLYLGPPRSGKGVHLIIPQTLQAPGPALVTSTRPDTLAHTLALRAADGPVAVFDPQGLAGDVPRLRWAPQHGCTDPLLAISRARALAAGAKLDGGGVTDGVFWQQMTEAVLRCYLHAAALSGATMRDVLGWVARPGDPTPIRILRTTDTAAPGWAEELAAQTGADGRQRDSVWAGVRRAVDALADPRVLDACSPSPEQAFDPVAFLRDRGTLYLLGTTGAQLSVAPLITALVEDLVDAARRLAADHSGGRLDPPLTLLLDEAANIAPIPSLPNLLSDGGGSGITTICVLQSLAQARARWGAAGADAMWDAATTKVVLGGLAHADDLSRISRLVGETDEPTRTRTTGSGGPSQTVAARRRPVLPVDELRCLPPGHALLLARRTPPVHAVLTPWWDGPHAADIRSALAPGAQRASAHSECGPAKAPEREGGQS